MVAAVVATAAGAAATAVAVVEAGVVAVAAGGEKHPASTHQLEFVSWSGVF